MASAECRVEFSHTAPRWNAATTTRRRQKHPQNTQTTQKNRSADYRDDRLGLAFSPWSVWSAGSPRQQGLHIVRQGGGKLVVLSVKGKGKPAGVQGVPIQ